MDGSNVVSCFYFLKKHKKHLESSVLCNIATRNRKNWTGDNRVGPKSWCLSPAGKGGRGEGIGEERPSSLALGNTNKTVFPVVVVQRDAKEMYQKSVIHKQRCCFDCGTLYCFFSDVRIVGRRCRRHHLGICLLVIIISFWKVSCDFEIQWNEPN